MSGLVLTDAAETEFLDPFTDLPRTIVLADRYYAKMKWLGTVVHAAADVVACYGLTGCALRDQGNRRQSLTTVLNRQQPGELLELPVQLPLVNGRHHPARLVPVKKPLAAAAISRRLARCKANKTGATTSAKQLVAANHLVLLTTLDAESWPQNRLVRLYRLRWQIELMYKSLKSILLLDDL